MVYEKLTSKLNFDERGALFEIYSEHLSHNIIPKHMYVSVSRKGVVRGFHQQLIAPQKKLIFCLAGEVADYALNIDPSNNDFGLVDGFNLSGDKGEGVVIGRNYAHGFECLSDHCSLLYICDQLYDPADQLTINPLDESLNLIWETKSPILSSKDLSGINISDFRKKLLAEK